MTVYEVIIPYRDRGRDPLRAKNLARVVRQWESYGMPSRMLTDGRRGDEQFNRSAAYNRGIATASGDCDGYVFTESDMLVDRFQLDEAIREAERGPGIVIPFTRYHYLDESESVKVRDEGMHPAGTRPKWTMDQGRAIGAINVISKKTMQMVGQFDERFEGSWYDDNATHIAFDLLAGQMRWVPGPAYHLHHLPGWQGDHLTEEDRAATERNKERLYSYTAAARRGDLDVIRKLVKGTL